MLQTSTGPTTARYERAESDNKPMLSPFDISIQCEEFFAGYEDWSDELQAEFDAANEAAQTVETEAGMMLIPRECPHAGCKSSRCSQGLRIGGFSI